MSDGFSVPFAIARGLRGAIASNTIVITAEIVAGSMAMGPGGYLVGKTEIEDYESELKREYTEVDEMPEPEKNEVKENFAENGLSESTQNIIADEISADKKKWVNFMMKTFFRKFIIKDIFKIL